MSSSLVIGICGGTGSGKTTLSQRLFECFESDAVLLGMDCYYKANYDIPLEERKKINYDHPNAFDTDLLIEHIKQLKQGQTIEHPTYDFSLYQRAKQKVTVQSKRLIILEGIVLFENKELSDLMDIKIFVDTDADVRIIRRIMRDVKERGRSLESVVMQYLQTVKPMHEQFTEPYKRRADIIVPEGGKNEVALELIINAIKRRLEGQ